MTAVDPGSTAGMTHNPREVVNDQTGESSPGVIDQVEQGDQTDIPASPTPEPPETAEGTEAAGSGR
jgi:hypothetical protein